LPTFILLCKVNVVSRKTLVEFCQKYPDAYDPLETWYKVCRKAQWRNFNEVKVAYPSADWVGDDRAVFNIKGNKYRLVGRFSFRYKSIQIKWIGTHGEYDRINVLNI
jgi:mRNA interferase HigB